MNDFSTKVQVSCQRVDKNQNMVLSIQHLKI